MSDFRRSGANNGRNPILLALDYPTLESARPVLDAVFPGIGGIKVGLELLHAVGTPQILKFLEEWPELDVLVDGKLYDIPNTVSGAAKAITSSGRRCMLNVAAAAGFDAIWAAVHSQDVAEVYAVTVLTSMTEEDCQLTFGASIKATVLKFARWAKLAGAGVICSAQHLEFLRKRPELEGLKYITPGVRSPGVEVNDQKQVDTPANAISNGATYIVVGREVTKAESPINAVERILRDITATKGA